MDSTKQVRYLELRQQLSELNCPSSFGVESCDCVDFLVKNIVSLTSSYKLSQEKESRLSADLALAQAQLFPLRKENARLARESHQLHEENIRCREESALFQTEQTSIRKKLEDRVNELIYLCKSKDVLLSKVEADRTRIKEAFELSIASPNTKTQSAIKVSKTLSQSPQKSRDSTSEFRAAMSQSAESGIPDADVIATLRAKLAEANDNIATINAENLKLAAALKMRDHELNRDARIIDANRHFEEEDASFGISKSNGIVDPSSLVPGGSRTSKLHQIAAAEASNRMLIDQLNSQVDFLNEQLAKRESQLVEMGNKLMASEYLQTENAQKTVLLDKLRAENNSLVSKAQSLEEKIHELQDALDPEGSVTVDELIELIDHKKDGAAHSSVPSHHISHPPPNSNRTGRTSTVPARSQAVTSRQTGPLRHSTTSRSAPHSAIFGSKKPVPSHGGNGVGSITDDVSDVSSLSAQHKEAKNSPLAVMRRAGVSGLSNRTARGGTKAEIEKLPPNAGQGGLVSKLTAERSQLQHEVTRLTAEVFALEADRHDLLENAATNKLSTSLDSADIKFTLPPSPPKQFPAMVLEPTSSPAEVLLKERLRRGDSRLQQLQTKAAEYQRQIEALSIKLTDRDHALSTIENDYNRLQTQLAEAKAQLSKESVSSNDIEVKMTETLARLQAVSAEKESLSAVVDGLRAEVIEARRQRAETAQNLEESISKFQRLEKLVEGRKDSVDGMLRDLTETRQQNVSLRLEMDRIEDELQSERRKAQSLTNSLKETEEALSKTRSELSGAAQQLLQLQANHSYLQSSADADSRWKVQTDMWRTRAEEAERQTSSLQHENSSLAATIQTLSAQSSTQGQFAAMLEDERKRSRDELNRKDQTIADLQREVRSLELTLDRANANAVTQRDALQASRATTESQSQQIAALNRDLAQNEADIKLLQKRLTDATSAYSESRGLATDSSRSMSILSDRCARAEEEVARISDALAASNREKASLEDELRDARRVSDTVQRRVTVDKDDIRRVQIELQESESRVAELKVLVAHMEASSKTHLERNARLTSALRESDDVQKKLELAVAQLKEACQEKDSAAKELAAKITVLEQERDEAISTLQSDEVVAEQRSRRGQQLEQHAAQLRGVVERLEGRLQDASAELAASQNQCATLDKRIGSLREDNLELKKKLGMKAAELGGASEDLMLMTRENQAVTAELAETVAERDRLHARLQHVSQAFADLEQIKRGLEIEKSDLLQAYKVVIQEKRQLDADIHNMGSLRQKASSNVQYLTERVAELTGIVNAHAMSESRWTVDRASMEHQIEELNDELIKAQKNVESVIADNRRLIQESHSLRQSNGMLTERMQLVIKRAASATDANKVLSSRISAVERERDAVRAMINLERQKASDMSQIVETARAQMADKDATLSRIIRDSASKSSSPPQVIGGSNSRESTPDLHQRGSMARDSSVGLPTPKTGTPGASSASAISSNSKVSPRAGGASMQVSSAKQTAVGSLAKEASSHSSDELSDSLGISYEEESFDGEGDEN